MEAQNPYHPVHLPEFDAAVGWAMCRNAMCPNFGIQFSGEREEGSQTLNDGRYRIDPKAGRLTCLACEQSFKLHSNPAIRRVARLFLSWSLPFADCPDESCANHGVNLFESHPRTARPSTRPYAREGADRARCRECGARFRLGTPLRLHGSRRNARRTLKEVFDPRTDDAKRRNAAKGVGVSAMGLFSHVRSAGDRLRDHLAWRNAKLLHPRFGRTEGPVRIATDVMTTSLSRLGQSMRWQAMPVAVTALWSEEHKTAHVIAAHPAYAPLSPGELHSTLDGARLSRRARTLGHECPWDCLEHPYRPLPGKSAGKRLKAQPEFTGDGLFVAEPHFLLAHFLVVRRMLRRFPKVHHYIDGSRPQMGAALTALADEVLAGRWEVAAVQRRQKKDGKSPKRVVGSTQRTQRTWEICEGAWTELQERWSERRAAEEGGIVPDPAVDARLFRKAWRGAFSEAGGWAWLEHPPGAERFMGGRTLWLTQRPGAPYATAGRELLREATMRIVDQVHSNMRVNAPALRRPALRSGAQRSYLESPKSAPVLLAELWMELWERGLVRLTKEGRITRMRAMGLGRANEREADPAEAALNFRLDFSHAERISNWLRT